MPNRSTGHKNENKLSEYLAKMQGTMPAIKSTLKPATNKIGRPIKRISRPARSAAKRTNPGEERYIVTMRTDFINTMKKIAEADGVLIKDAFAEAIENYITKKSQE